ncbi:Androglobin [Acipenser ruthenus]|uniref:Androglobin n=1 Tax=Acipenser ruthenus TaxID=7906 RepID=A0A444UI23_ACIRT|nr:Androglobin [Acipenser ruthenus]
MFPAKALENVPVLEAAAEAAGAAGELSATMHKYVIQATVLHKSWTLNESELAYVQVLKEAEKLYERVQGEKPEEATTPVRMEAPHIDSQKPAVIPPKSSTKKGREKPVEKSEKDKPSKEKEKIVPLSPPSCTGLVRKPLPQAVLKDEFRTMQQQKEKFEENGAQRAGDRIKKHAEEKLYEQLQVVKLICASC